MKQGKWTCCTRLLSRKLRSHALVIRHKLYPSFWLTDNTYTKSTKKLKLIEYSGRKKTIREDDFRDYEFMVLARGGANAGQ